MPTGDFVFIGSVRPITVDQTGKVNRGYVLTLHPVKLQLRFTF